jgi:hypothetical protein
MDAPSSPSPHINGSVAVLNGDTASEVPSHVVDSPTTPISDSAPPNVKIDIDYQEQESDARHEPLLVKIDHIDPSCMSLCLSRLFYLLKKNLWRVFLGFFLLAAIPTLEYPVSPGDDEPMPENQDPNGDVQGELVEDVQMEELMLEPNGHPNGKTELDLSTDVQTPDTPPVSSSLPAASSSTTIESIPVSTPYSTPNDSSRNDDDMPPPAKRARMHSDADKASLAHVSVPRLVRLRGVLIMYCPSEVRNFTSSIRVASTCCYNHSSQRYKASTESILHRFHF